MQWLNRHKIIGSNNWIKAQMQITRLHRKIANNSKGRQLSTVEAIRLLEEHGIYTPEDFRDINVLVIY